MTASRSSRRFRPCVPDGPIRYPPRRISTVAPALASLGAFEMSITSSLYAKARSEIIALFGWSADDLSPDQVLRVDCAVALRLALDDLQGRIVRGESADVARMLTASEALARLLPPAVLSTPPAEEHGDPRAGDVADLLGNARAWRGAARGLASAPHRRTGCRDCYAPGPARGCRARTRIARCRSSPQTDDSTAINPPSSDIVPPSERAECDAGVSLVLMIRRRPRP